MPVSRTTLLVVGLILVAGLSRLLFAGIPNVAPIAAMALFGGVLLQNRSLGLLIPLVALAFSDVVLHLFTPWGVHATMPFVYASMAGIVALGWLVKKKFSFPAVLGGSLAGSLIFFIVSNLGVWITSPMYPLNYAGLVQCFTMAIPFFHYSVLGDLLFNGALFGSAFYIFGIKPAKTAAIGTTEN